MLSIQSIRDIDRLTNAGLSIDDKRVKDDILYLIHCIIDEQSSEKHQPLILAYLIMSKEDTFVKILE